MPDVILVYPRTLWDIRNVTTRLPLAALYIGTVLEEHGFTVQVIDQRVDDDWAGTLRRVLGEPGTRPLWVGVSAMTGRQIHWGLQAAQIVRQVAPGTPIVWGGVHPTILPEQTLAHPLVDLVAVGEGEITALELAQALRAGREAGRPATGGPVTGDPERMRAIDGLVWTLDGEVVHNAPRRYTPMDEWPPLDYGLVDAEHYVLAEVPGERSLQITTSRGCPMRCGYCYLTVVPDGRRYRAESPERTVDRIERMLEQFNLNAIHIIDDEFFTQRQRARRVCELIVERGIEVTLRTNCRIDYVDRMSLDDLRLFRQAGFKHLYLGAESGNDRVLDVIAKGITRDQILRANAKLRQAGIAPKFSFMGGFPGESIAEVKDTIRLMERLVRENPEAYTTPVQLYSPYPGTPLFDSCVAGGMEVPGTLEGWTESGWEHIDYSWLSRGEERFLQKAAYFTFFLDGKTVAESSPLPLMRLAMRAYGWVVRQRVRLDFYACMPEVHLIKWALANVK
jgi:anaerobic magnesium-protoporphyrin IX monomethyl ester cyclase